jgi:16S rRNA (guanine(527)-N(7))-methyltransferase RsmG
VTRLPPLSGAELAARLARACPGLELPEAFLRTLLRYYEELARWAPRVDLIGPGTAAEAVERHFAESLAALPLLPAGPGRLVDLGSGAGFPGLVLAAARPDLEVTLVEPRERRRAFLAAVARACSLRVDLLGATVARRALDRLPEAITVLTVRALRLAPEIWSGLAGRLAPGGIVLVWSGAQTPELAPQLVLVAERPLAGSHRRFLRAYGARRWEPGGPGTETPDRRAEG